MSFDIFDENFYLASYPDVAAAVAAGVYSSGLQHFQAYGLAEGRVLISPLYDEQLYLQANPDVANAVSTGAMTGLQHFIQFGEAEGRVGLFDLYNEQIYLQRYPDVANAISAGIFTSGLEHFLQNGQAEGRSGSVSFNEEFYLRNYPDVANAVAAGVFSSGLEHFTLYGEAEKRSGSAFNEEFYLVLFPDVADAVAQGIFNSGTEHYLRFGQYEDSRVGIFTGTNGNDIIRSFGGDTSVTGVHFEVEATDPITGGPRSFGVGEVDVLIGFADGREIFNLGAGNAADTGTQKYYVGGGDADYALVRNFDPTQDFIQLAGSFDEYTQTVVNNSLNISTTAGDLVGIVADITNPLSVYESGVLGTFNLG